MRNLHDGRGAPAGVRGPWLFGWSGCGWFALSSAIVVIGSFARFVYNQAQPPRMDQSRRHSPGHFAGAPEMWLPTNPTETVVAPPPFELRSGRGWAAFRTDDGDAQIPSNLVPRLVPFSFQYPAARFERLVEQPPNASAFVGIEEWDTEADVVREKLAVTPVTMPTTTASDRDYESVLCQFSDGFRQRLGSDYRDLGQTSDSVGGYRARTLRYAVTKYDAKGHPVPIYGRTIVVCRPGQIAGLALVMMATQFDPHIKSTEDVGSKGDLAIILRSFRFLP